MARSAAKCPTCHRAMPKPKKARAGDVWPSLAFWRAAYIVLAFTDHSWGRPLAPGVDQTWHKGRLRLSAGGSVPAVEGWRRDA